MNDRIRDDWVELGRTGGAYGFRGWVRVHPLETGEVLLKRRRWFLVSNDGKVETLEVTGCRRHGTGLVAKWTGCESKEEADVKKGRVYVAREDFPQAGRESVWAVDLIGCRVVNVEGVELGVLEEIGSNGVQDLFVIGYEAESGKRAHFMIPNVKDVYVLALEPEKQTITVDWSAEWR